MNITYDERLDNIPQELKGLDSWVLWKLEKGRGKKPTKKPYQVNGALASTTNPKTWTGFKEAMEVYKSNSQYSGIGFVFSGSGYTGIDIDGCINDEVIGVDAQYIIDQASSYTEKSQSGKGIHIILKGAVKEAVKKDIEIYSEGRFFALTGDIVGDVTNINEGQKLIDELYDKYKGGKKKTSEEYIPESKKNLDIKELLKSAFGSKNGFKIEALYNGDWQSQNIYSSQSEADQALCNYLAYWLDKDFHSIDEVFSESGLYRSDKWDREDYKTNTILKAINGCEETYQEQQKLFEYDFSDLGIAQRFKDEYKDVLKFVVDAEFYIKWNGKQWVRFNKDLPVKTLALEFVKTLSDRIKKYIEYLDDDKQKSTYEKLAGKVKSDRVINIASKHYKSFSDTHIHSDMLDKDIRYINCNNGVVDTTTGEIYPHRKELYITKLVDADYIKGYINELYKGAVNRLFKGDKEEFKAFEILLGYMLSGKANLKTFPIIHGSANSGKSKIFEIILKTFGSDYVKTIDKSLLMKEWNKSSSASPELAELQGARLLICSETSDSDYFNTDFIKKIVGGDTIKARPLYLPPIEFRPIFVPVIFTNERPSFDGNNDALVSRLMVIELLYSIDGAEIDPNFETKVMEDKTGVLSYLVSCIVKFNSSGKLAVPQRWSESIKDYVEENNPYKVFMKEALEVNKGGTEYTKEVYAAFEMWHQEEGTKAIPTAKRLTMELKKLGVGHARRGGSVYLGISLKPQWRSISYRPYSKAAK